MAKEISEQLNWLERGKKDAERRFVNASNHGFLLAEAVSDYMKDPTFYGTDYISKAHHVFMSAHSGNFNQSPEETIASLEANAAQSKG